MEKVSEELERPWWVDLLMAAPSVLSGLLANVAMMSRGQH